MTYREEQLILKRIEELERRVADLEDAAYNIAAPDNE